MPRLPHVRTLCQSEAFLNTPLSGHFLSNIRAALMLIVALSSLCVPAAASGFLFDMPPNLVTLDCGRRNSVFQVGEPVTFTLTGTAAVRYEVHDYYGILVDQGAVASPLTLHVSQPGWYKIDLFGSTFQDPWGTSVGGTTFVIFRPDPRFPALPPKGTYGGDPGQFADQVMRGVTGMGPRRIPVADCNDPAGAIAALEPEIAAAQQYYLPYDPARKRVLMVAFPNGTGNADGVRQIVSHFKGRVAYWEGRNEPNSGSPLDFVAEERAFYQAVKSADPAAKVLGPGVVTVGPFGIGWMDGFFGAGGGQYIDALSFHAYNNVNGDPFLARQSLDALQALLDKYKLGGIEKWQTEQGYMAAVYGAYQPRLQGRWTMLQMLLYEQYGIPKEHNHLWYDVSGFWEEPMFWENDDGSLNPAAALMRVWSEELYGATFSKAYGFGPNGDKLYLGDLFTGAGRRVAAFMSGGSTDGKVTLSVTGGASLHVVSAFGAASDLAVVNGQVVLPVSVEPVYVEMASGQDVTPVPLNWGPDLALGATPTASGTGHNPNDQSIVSDIGKLVNGYMDTFYWALTPDAHPWADDTQGSPAWVTLALPSVQTIDHVVVYACPPWQWEGTLLDYELQYDRGGQWVTIERVQEPTNTAAVFTPTTRTTVDSYFSDRWVFQHSFAPVTTGKIRLLVHDTTYGGGATQAVQLAEGPEADPQTGAKPKTGPDWGPHNVALREVEVFNSVGPLPAFRLDCGGGAYSSATAGSWQADAYYGNRTATYTFPVSSVVGTPDPSLYRSVRYGMDSFRYLLPAFAGSYTLKLHFMEGDRTGPGQRVFSVSVNGMPVLSNFDVFQDAGGQGIADVKSFPVTCDGTGVTVSFQSSVSTAMISAIELIPAGPALVPLAPSSLSAAAGDGRIGLTWSASAGAVSYDLYRATSPGGEGSTPVVTNLSGTSYTDTGLTNGTTYYYRLTAANTAGESAPTSEASATPQAAPVAALRIDGGGPDYSSATSGLWQADTDFTGGATYTFWGAVTGTPDPDLYRTVRYSSTSFGYRLPATAGSYTLRLHFVEGDSTVGVGTRVFNVSANGTPVLTNFDVFQDAGGLGIADDKSFPVTSDGSGVTVGFQALASTAMVSAVELIPTGPAPPVLTTLSPTSVTAGRAGFLLTLTGSGFVAGQGSQALLTCASGSVTVPLTVISPTQATVPVPASLLSVPGTVVVQVGSQTPGGGTSNSLNLQVLPVGPTNLITTVSLSRVNGNLLTSLVVTNIGSKGAGNVQITNVSVGGVTCTPSTGGYPLYFGTIDPGGAATYVGTVLLPVSPPGSTVIVKVNGTYASGTFGGSTRLTAP